MTRAPFLLAGVETRSGHTHEVRSPWDGSVVTTLELAVPEHVEAALQAAERARDTLAALSADARARILERARDLLHERAEAFVQALVEEAGKPVRLARIEVARAEDTLTDSAWAARSLRGDVEPLDAVGSGLGKMAVVRRAPVGPVTAITPFNFPLNLVLHKLGPAIAAGCPVILKPALETSTASLLAGRLLLDAGLPPDAISVLPLEHGHAEPLITDPRVRLISFTGSGKVGWDLRALARGKRVLLELGGNATSIVCADADVAAAASKLAVGAFAYAGQSCISVQNILVHPSRRDELLSALLAATAKLAAGDPHDPEVWCGPVLRERDADRITAWVDEAIAGGAKVALRGTRAGNLIPPIVLVDTPRTCRAHTDEIFGPVVNVLTFDTLDEAIGVVNASVSGLQASIFTSDLRSVLYAHARLEVGALVHDEATAFRVDAQTYGGVKESGLGREGPRHAVLEYTEPRLLVVGAPGMR